MCEAAQAVEDLLTKSTQDLTKLELNFKQFDYCYNQYPVMKSVANLILVEQGVLLRSDLSDENSTDEEG